MNDFDLDALFAAARAGRRDTSKAEYGFETRMLARLRSQRQAQGDTGSVWAMVSWRMIPLFAACVMALAVWHSQVAALADDAEAFNSVEHPETADLFSN